MKYSKAKTQDLKRKLDYLLTMSASARLKGDAKTAQIFKNEAKSLSKSLVKNGTF
jgi:hypothetical protein